eukprot:2788465-Alexandrium_andersonii.AAC.1
MGHGYRRRTPRQGAAKRVAGSLPRAPQPTATLPKEKLRQAADGAARPLAPGRGQVRSTRCQDPASRRASSQAEQLGPAGPAWVDSALRRLQRRWCVAPGTRAT